MASARKDPSRRRELVTLIVALGAHVAFIALPKPRLPVAAVGERPLDVIEIVDEGQGAGDTARPSAPLPAAAANEAPAAANEAPARGVEPPPRAEVAPPSVKGAEAPPAPPNQGPSDNNTPPEAPRAGAVAPPPPAGGGVPREGPPSQGPPSKGPSEYGAPPPAIGVPGLNGPVWAMPGVLPSAPPPSAAPTVAPAAPALDKNVAGKVLDGTMKKRDRELGLDTPAAGVVASSLVEAVRRSAIPGDTRATFEVRLNGEGKVEGVKLVSSTAGDATSWGKVLGAAQKTLGGKQLQMGSDKRGATVTVKVESKVQYPAGSQEQVNMKPVCANDVINQIEALVNNPQALTGVAAQQPGQGAKLGVGALGADAMDEEAKRKFCIPVGIRGTLDAANLGAHAINVVKSTSIAVRRDGDRAMPAEEVKPVDTRVPWAPVDPTKVRAPPPPKKKKKRGPKLTWN